MPKLKTNRLARKKYKVTGKGRIKRSQAFKSHNTSKRGPKRRRKLTPLTMINSADERTAQRLMPYYKTKQ